MERRVQQAAEDKEAAVSALKGEVAAALPSCFLSAAVQGGVVSDPS